ncbi:hypothetical protein V8G54_000167 (mitochondrion) [Vigna mungo]|uniref:Uncharacterized protein n=1 Tax=Vigna mungo TaxID=3915 RepID=A0AAQ3PJB4_VIGMU
MTELQRQMPPLRGSNLSDLAVHSLPSTRDQDSLQLAPIAALSGRRLIEKAAAPPPAYLLVLVARSEVKSVVRRKNRSRPYQCFATTVAGGNSLMVEHSLAKAEVEGSSPSFRSWLRPSFSGNEIEKKEIKSLGPLDHPSLEPELNLNNSIESSVTGSIKGKRRSSSMMKAAELKTREGFQGLGRVDSRARGGSEDSRSGPGFESNRPSLSSQGEASSRSWTSCSHSSKPGVDSRGRAEPHLAVGRSSLLGRVQTGLKGGGMKDSDLTGDSSLARANQSMGICKSRTFHKNLSDPLAVTPCPIRSSSFTPLKSYFFIGKRKKREKEWAQPHARVFDPKGI